jgi:hypothetical protein
MFIKPNNFDEVHDRQGMQHRLKDGKKWVPLGIGEGGKEDRRKIIKRRVVSAWHRKNWVMKNWCGPVLMPNKKPWSGKSVYSLRRSTAGGCSIRTKTTTRTHHRSGKD